MCKTARHDVLWHKVFGPVPPQMAEIEEYCAGLGHKEEMSAAEEKLRGIKESKEHFGARDGARVARQQ